MTYKYRVEELALKAFKTVEKETVTGLLAILTRHPDWQGVFGYDEFACSVVAKNPPIRLEAEGVGGLKNHDVAAVRAWLQAQPKEKKQLVKGTDDQGQPTEEWKTYVVGRDADEKTVKQAILLAAHARRFHPVRDYLDALARPTIDEAHLILDGLPVFLHIEDPLCWFKRQLVAAVRRVRQPGCKHDHMLVLIGEKQGQGKSTLCFKLFEPWFQDNLPDLGSKAAANSLRGFWCVELAELEKILRVDDATAKAFLSRTEDVYDIKYEPDVSRFPRSCVFFGTSNDPECLRDPSGNRRYWPVRVVKHMDLEGVAKMRDSLWAAANVLAETDFRTWMTPADEEQADKIRDEFLLLDPWFKEIERFIRGKAQITIPEVWEHIGATGTAFARRQGELANLGRVERNRIGSCLRQLGCTRAHGVWRVPGTSANVIPLRAVQAPA